MSFEILWQDVKSLHGAVGQSCHHLVRVLSVSSGDVGKRVDDVVMIRLQSDSNLPEHGEITVLISINDLIQIFRSSFGIVDVSLIELDIQFFEVTNLRKVLVQSQEILLINVGIKVIFISAF